MLLVECIFSELNMEITRNFNNNSKKCILLIRLKYPNLIQIFLVSIRMISKNMFRNFLFILLLKI